MKYQIFVDGIEIVTEKDCYILKYGNKEMYCDFGNLNQTIEEFKEGK